jgi:uncharacterized protein (DUF885 family)
MPYRFVTFAALALSCLVIGCAKPTPPAPSAFAGFMADIAQEWAQDSPERATRLGLARELAGRDFTRNLDDRSADAVARRRNMALRRAAQLRQFDRASLSEDDQISFDVLSESLAGAAVGARFAFGRFEQTGAFSPYALNQLDSAFLTLPDFFDTRVPVRNLAEARDYVLRLQRVAGVLDQETARAAEDAASGRPAPLFVIDRTLAAAERQFNTPPAEQAYVTGLRRKLEAITGPIAPPAPQEPGQAPPPGPSADVARAQALLAQAESIVATAIQPAHARTIQTLRSLRAGAAGDAGIWRLPEGAAFYAAALAQQTTTNLTPDQIHDQGAVRVAALTQELDGALRVQGLTDGSVGQRLSILSRDPRFLYPATPEGRAQLIGDAQARISAMLSLAPKHFAVLPAAKLEVRAVPALLEPSASGAYYEAPSLDGASPGIYYINLRDMAQMTKIDLPTQDYHEGVPGHHFQVALAREQKTLPLFRRMLEINAYGEGWALYGEQLADEIGLYENDPIGRIGYLRWQLWRAARLVVDTGLHAKKWSREQAINYLLETTGDHPDVVISEVERYAVWPGQACGYELGRAEIVRLREMARRALGPGFQMKNFHTVILANGDTPLPVLETLVQLWIARAEVNPR